MNEYKLNEIERIKKEWNNSADTYEDWYETFRGAVDTHVDLELLRKYLPENKDAEILDSAGGTGRITLPLAKMGYSVTLCDISPNMLDVAKQKMRREGVYDKVKILECDIRKLYFADESFDFVLCWNGAMDAAEEIIRVTKTGGMISVFLVNKWRYAVYGFRDSFRKDPEDPDLRVRALALIESKPSYVKHHGYENRAVSVDEARNFFKAKGIRVLDIYAVCGWIDVLGIPEEVQESRDWDKKYKKLFEQTVEMTLKLGKEPSVKRMSKHLVLYGEKM